MSHIAIKSLVRRIIFSNQQFQGIISQFHLSLFDEKNVFSIYINIQENLCQNLTLLCTNHHLFKHIKSCLKFFGVNYYMKLSFYDIFGCCCIFISLYLSNIRRKSFYPMASHVMRFQAELILRLTFPFHRNLKSLLSLLTKLFYPSTSSPCCDKVSFDTYCTIKAQVNAVLWFFCKRFSHDL